MPFLSNALKSSVYVRYVAIVVLAVFDIEAKRYCESFQEFNSKLF